MRELLLQFEAELLARGFEPGYSFQSDAPAADVAVAFAETGYSLPPDLLALYAWKNGTAKQSATEFATYFATLDAGNQNVLWPDRTKKPRSYCYCRTDFFPEIGTFIPLLDAATSYREAKEENFWPANFWPIFNDDTLLLDVDAASKTYGQVHLYSPSLIILEPAPYYDSLNAMFTTYLTALMNGFVPYGPDFELNFSNYRKLAKRLNPLSTYWLF